VWIGRPHLDFEALQGEHGRRVADVAVGDVRLDAEDGGPEPERWHVGSVSLDAGERLRRAPVQGAASTTKGCGVPGQGPTYPHPRRLTSDKGGQTSRIVRYDLASGVRIVVVDGLSDGGWHEPGGRCSSPTG
jgi:hypothetical protein